MDDENFIPAPAPAAGLNKQTFFAEYRNLIVLGGLLLTTGAVFLASMLLSSKSLAIVKPAKAASVKAGETITISWASKGISSVGIVLFNGDTPQWLAKGISAGRGKYDWVVPDNQESSSDYRLAVFEFPWKKGNVITYTKDAIQVIGPKYSSCANLSVESEWPFLPGNYPNAKKIFITEGQWNGNLGGLDGADAKCQQQADSAGYKGKFIAFLGSDKTSAKERVAANSLFVLAKSAAKLAEGQDCYRLIARDVDSLLNKALLASQLMGVEMDSDFARLAQSVWYGRRTATAKTDCLGLSGVGAVNAFSGTYTCQNWSTSQGQVYQGAVPPDADLTRCYNSQGSSIFANYLAANASSLTSDGNLIVIGATCDRYNRLLCVEQ